MTQSPVSRVALDLPSEWDDLSTLTFIGPGDGFRANVVVSHEPYDDKMTEAYAKLQCEGLAEETDNYEQHSLEAVTINGISGTRVEHSFEADEDVMPMRQIQLFLGKDGNVYTLSFTHRASEFDGAREMFDKVIGSIQIG